MHQGSECPDWLLGIFPECNITLIAGSHGPRNRSSDLDPRIRQLVIFYVRRPPMRENAIAGEGPRAQVP